MAGQQQQQQLLPPPSQHKCRITFATISSLQPRPDASDIKQAQLALASTVLSGLQLLQPGGAPPQEHQQHAPLAWLQLPLVGLPDSSSGQATASTSSSIAKGSQEMIPLQEAVRRFPFVDREQQPKQPGVHSSGSSSSRPPADRNKLRTRGNNENPANSPAMVCLETDAGDRQRVYHIRRGVEKSSGRPWEGFDMVSDQLLHQQWALHLCCPVLASRL